MVIWALTAGIGIYLLAAGIAAQRAAGLARVRAAAADNAASGAAAGPDGAAPAGADGAAPAGADGAAPAVGTQALAVVPGSGQAPAAPPVDGSPLLEFTHPALALLGLTFWIFFVMTGDRVFAWIALGVVVATVTAGLSWELSRRRTARQRAAGDAGGANGPRFPPHLVLAHGVAAACTFALVVIAAVAAGH